MIFQKCKKKREKKNLQSSTFEMKFKTIKKIQFKLQNINVKII